jgi:hypothetical protein
VEPTKTTPLYVTQLVKHWPLRNTISFKNYLRDRDRPRKKKVSQGGPCLPMYDNKIVQVLQNIYTPKIEPYFGLDYCN